MQSVISKTIKQVVEGHLLEYKSFNQKDIGNILISQKYNAITGEIAGSACSLSWKMVLQDPQMTLSTAGNHKQHKSELQQQIHAKYECETLDCQPDDIIHYLEPTLKSETKVLIKGRVKIIQDCQCGANGTETGKTPLKSSKTKKK